MSDINAGFRQYAAFATKQLANEEAAAVAFSGRATAVITTSGALVTASLALGAIVAGSGRLTIGRFSAGAILCGLALFLASALMAIAVLAPSLRRSVDVGGMATEFRSNWDATEAIATRKIMATDLELLDELQKINDRKGTLLFVATLMQAMAFTSLALAVASIIVLT